MYYEFYTVPTPRKANGTLEGGGGSKEVLTLYVYVLTLFLM